MIITDIQLRPVRLDQDIPALYAFHISDDLYLYSTQIRFNTQQQFYDWLTGNLRGAFHDFMVVTYKNQIIGFAYSYDFSVWHGHCKIAVYLSPSFRTVGVGAYAAIQFMSHLFNSCPLRKLYLTIYDYNRQSLESNLKAGFIEEGSLKKYRYYNGAYHDLHILSMDRDTFRHKLEKLVK